MSYFRRIASSLSTTGLIIGLALVSLSLTPSLLPRDVATQGILSGIVFAAGYIVGKMGRWTWSFMDLKDLSQRKSYVVSCILLAILTLSLGYTLNQMTLWQNSIRVRMELKPIDSAYPLTVLLLSSITGVLLITLTRLGMMVAARAVNWVNRFMPRKMAIVFGNMFFVFLLIFIVNGVLVKGILHLMDDSFATINRVLDENHPKPLGTNASGSKSSLINWVDIGRNGKIFINNGPTKDEIEEVLGRKAQSPIRVYAGYDTGDSLEERAQIALAELKRVGGFDRSVLIVASPTGTGWLDPSAVNPLEFIHAGDIATVSLQYSYLPSWTTLLVEPDLSRRASGALFRAIHSYWMTLPPQNRPDVYLHGLSLGALGSSDSLNLITILTDPIKGALWSGPPFLSRAWNLVTKNRLQDSPLWRPTYKDSSTIRFMTQEGFAPELTNTKWGPIRVIYLQHASDPMTFFSTNLAFSKPDWLGANRGHDVSPHLTWFPIVTFLQSAFDIFVATSVPIGYGHNFSPDSYIDAWIEVTQPVKWNNSDTEKLKAHFNDFNPQPI